MVENMTRDLKTSAQRYDIGTLTILPVEVRCQVWRIVSWSHAEWKTSRYGDQDDLDEPPSHFGLPVLRTCHAIHYEVLYEIYDLSDLVLRMDTFYPRWYDGSDSGNPPWAVKDMRKLGKTYATYIPLGEMFYFVTFVNALQEHSRNPKIRIEICPPTQLDPDPMWMITSRALEYKESLDMLLSNSSSKRRIKLEIVLLDGNNQANWSGVHTLEPGDEWFQRVTVSDAQAVLHLFSSFRNLHDVKIVLPQNLKDDKQMVDFAWQMEKDLTSEKSTWLAERSRTVAKARESKWAFDPSLMLRNIELSLHLQYLLDSLPGYNASLRARAVKDMRDSFYVHRYWRTCTIYHNSKQDLSVSLGSQQIVDRKDIGCAMYMHEKAARIWSGEDPIEGYMPPLDLKFDEWEDLLECAMSAMVEEQ